MKIKIERVKYEVEKDIYFLFFTLNDELRYCIATKNTVDYLRLKNKTFEGFEVGDVLNLFQVPNTKMFKIMGVNYD